MDLLTSDDFARWFAAQDARTAEDVAATLEVIEQLGSQREAPGSSEWLTWYEHPSLSESLRELHPLNRPGRPPDPALVRFIHEWGEFYGYTRRVVKHLESRAFAQRLGHLDPERAAAVDDAVAHIRKTATRRTLAMSELQQKRRLGVQPLTPAEEREMTRLIDVAEIRRAYLAALQAAGFSMDDVPAHSPALREIAVRAPAPGFRVLYGIDVKRDRGFVVLGEAMDHAFYGDSVRVAERAWQEFLGQPSAGVKEKSSP